MSVFMMAFPVMNMSCLRRGRPSWIHAVVDHDAAGVSRTSHDFLHSSSWEHRERLGERSATRPGARFQKGFSGMNSCRIAQCVDKGIRGLVLGFNTPPPDLAGVKPKRRAHFSVNICDNDPQEGPPRCRARGSPLLPSARPPSWSTGTRQRL